jgi:hypothetical protein
MPALPQATACLLSSARPPRAIEFGDLGLMGWAAFDPDERTKEKICITSLNFYKNPFFIPKL